MRIAVYLPLVMPLLLMPFTRPIGERLPPRAAAWLLTAVAVLLAMFSAAVTVLVVLAGAAQIPLIARCGHWSVQTVRHALDPGAPIIAAIGAGVIVAIAVGVTRATRRYVRTVQDNRLALRGTSPDCELVVLPDPLPVAYALPGRPAHVVVSTGMLAALDASEQRALLAHERAHLAGGHHLFLAATRIAARINPLLRPLHGAVAYAVERWADEAAARAVGDRTVTARAIAKAALAAQDVHTPASPLLAAVAGPVPRRITALLHPTGARPVHVRGLVTLAALATLALSAAATLEATVDLHTLLEIAHAATGG